MVLSGGGGRERGASLVGLPSACSPAAGGETPSCLSRQLLEEDGSWDAAGFHGFCGSCNCAGGDRGELLSDSPVAFLGGSGGAAFSRTERMREARDLLIN